jgi:hypothetical protein
MLNVVECGAPNVLRIQASGQLTEADHHAFLCELDALRQKYGKVRVLFEVSGLEGWEDCSAWDDPVCSLRSKDHVKRFAVVGEKKDREWEKRLAEPFVNVRFFEPEEREKAWHWVVEGAQSEIDREWISHLAYAKWEAAGRPEGDGLKFWVEAERELLHTHSP